MLLVATVCACLALSLLLTSCGLMKRTKSLFGGKLPIQVGVADDVNQQSPVAVELIVVYNKKILDKLLEKSAREWFEGRAQFQRDYPKGYQTWSWEWVPGQEVQPFDVPIKSGAQTGIIFADYFSPGAHRARIDPRKPLRIELGTDDFTTEESL